MYQLMVSHNCGMSYGPDRQAGTLEALEGRMCDLDEQRFRWYVTKDGEELMTPVCQIHHSLLAFIQYLNEQNTEAPDA